MNILKAIILVGCASTLACAQTSQTSIAQLIKSDAEWKRILTPERYEILRHADTERPYKNEYWDKHDKGTYVCAGCGLELFKSDWKFESHTGWPSFWTAIPGHVVTKDDHTDNMDRTEVLCARCGGHLGHVFDDGPRPTGLRYCMNSGAMIFKPAAKK
jgi:peptide-methionine (R)-S-oxide reductase